ncbi:MAG: hypothetical protein M3282_10280 [Gemmatimonadota bacterium]|nr:hypothetical protein [Gemmatimonadota bacterium]
MTPFSHDDFLTRTVAAFPELADDVDACAGMPTLQAAAFAHRLQRAKGEADWDTYERGIKLVAELWDEADEQLGSELRWSFIKALDFEGVRGPVAWSYLTPEMQRAWTQSQKYLAELSALPRKTKKRAR